MTDSNYAGGGECFIHHPGDDPESEHFVVVCGPTGCGKTMESERLRDAFGMSSILDDWSIASGYMPRAGEMALSQDCAMRVFLFLRAAMPKYAFTVMDFDYAVAQCNG